MPIRKVSDIELEGDPGRPQGILLQRWGPCRRSLVPGDAWTACNGRSTRCGTCRCPRTSDDREPCAKTHNLPFSLSCTSWPSQVSSFGSFQPLSHPALSHLVLTWGLQSPMGGVVGRKTPHTRPTRSWSETTVGTKSLTACPGWRLAWRHAETHPGPGRPRREFAGLLSSLDTRSSPDLLLILEGVRPHTN